MKQKIFILLFVLFGTVAATCQVGYKISIFDMHLDEQVPKLQPFGMPIDLKLKEKAKLPRDFHVRIFRGTLKELEQRSPDKQGCMTFSTLVLSVTVRASIRIQSLDDPAWLRPVRDHFESEDYVLIFESGEQPSDSVIRIHKTQAKDYFKYAFPIRLIAPLKLSEKNAPEIVQAAETTLSKRGTQFVKVAESPCYRVAEDSVITAQGINRPSKVAHLESLGCDTTTESVAKIIRAEEGSPENSGKPKEGLDVSVSR